MGILDIYSQLGQQAMQPGGMLGTGLAQPTEGMGGGYQPNYPLFWNPRQMLSMGQPSFTDPMWYQAGGGAQQTFKDLPAEQPEPLQQRVNDYVLRQMFNLDNAPNIRVTNMAGLRDLAGRGSGFGLLDQLGW